MFTGLDHPIKHQNSGKQSGIGWEEEQKQIKKEEEN